MSEQLLRWAVSGFFLIAIPATYGCPNDEPSSSSTPTVDATPTEAWLDRIEQRAKSVRTLKADLRYDRIQNLQRSKQIRDGKIIYIAGPPAKFAIHFHRLKENRRPIKQNVWYIFDGQWIVERHEEKKLFIKNQIVDPEVSSDKSDPLALGAGPFPVPVTFKKEDIRRQFDVLLDEGDAEKDPIHLKLTPKPDQRINFTEIHLWYDRETLLPLRLRTLDDSDSESIVHLRNIKVNDDVAPESVDTSEPKEKGWRVDINPYRKKTRPAKGEK